MKSSGCRVRKHVGNRAADDRSNDAEHDCPENRHVHVHHRFRDNPRDQPNNNVPDQVNHNFSSVVCPQKLPSMARRFTIDQTFLEKEKIRS